MRQRGEKAIFAVNQWRLERHQCVSKELTAHCVEGTDALRNTGQSRRGGSGLVKYV
jgi:hypothetical protein